MKKGLLAITAALLAAGSFYLIADDRVETRYDAQHETSYQNHVGVPVTPKHTAKPSETQEAKQYRDECGACHMAYQPGLLPKRSWQRIMTTLENHFGSDATLERADAKTIGGYLDAHAYGSMPASKHMRKIATSVSPDAPMQITKSRYFVKEHREIPLRYVTQAEVKSFANCNACHGKAESGSYREREIFIPNYGRWDD